MTTENIYKLAKSINDKKANEILSNWKENKDSKKIESVNALVRLGDSLSLAIASTIAKKENNEDFYYNAYCI